MVPSEILLYGKMNYLSEIVARGKIAHLGGTVKQLYLERPFCNCFMIRSLYYKRAFILT